MYSPQVERGLVCLLHSGGAVQGRNKQIKTQWGIKHIHYYMLQESPMFLSYVGAGLIFLVLVMTGTGKLENDNKMGKAKDSKKAVSDGRILLINSSEAESDDLA